MDSLLDSRIQTEQKRYIDLETDTSSIPGNWVYFGLPLGKYVLPVFAVSRPNFL